MKRLIVIISCSVFVLLVSALGCWFWAYHPFWLKEGVCQLRRVPYPMDTYEYLPIFVATSDHSPASTEPTKQHSQFFDINTPTISFSGSIQKRPNGYEIMIDRDCDGAFLDEEPILGKKFVYKQPSSIIPWQFGPICVHQKNGILSAPFYLIVQPIAHRVYVCPTTAYYGRIRLNNTLFRIYVNDSDLDCQLKSLFNPDLRGGYHPHCDSVSLDRYQSNHSDGYIVPVVPLARMIKIGRTLYTFNVTEQFQLTMTPTQPELGRLVLKGIDSADAKYWSDAACGFFSFSGDELTLPVGRYTLEYFNVQGTDANGITWKADSSHNLTEPSEVGLVSDFEIRFSESTSIVMGTPLNCIIEPEEKNGTIELDFKLIGKAGERYDPRLSYAPDANQPPDFRKPSQPSFSIIDEQGATVDEGHFEYG